MASHQIQRVLTGVVLVPAVLALVLFAPLKIFAAVVGIVALLALREYLDLAEHSHLAPMRYLAYVFGALSVLYPLGVQGPIVFTVIAQPVLLVLLALALGMRSSRDLAASLAGAASTVLGVFYVALPLSWLVLMRQAVRGEYLVVYVLVVTWVGDTAAYYTGRALGRHKLAPRLSPSKTWEGSGASLITSLAAGALLLNHYFPEVPLWLNLATGLAVNVAGQIGDLAESALKRGAGVKDSGALLPGHGGLLDRIDALLFAIPVLWYDINLVLSSYL